MTEVHEREFWRKYAVCLEAQAQVIQTYWLTPSDQPRRVFNPTMSRPEDEKQFWEGLRRNLLSQAAVIKTSKIGGSAGVKLGSKRRRYPLPKLDGKPEKRGR